MVTHLPFGGNNWGNSYRSRRPARRRPDVEYSAQIRPVSPGYFATLGIPLKQGRDFTESDNETAPGVTIVNEVFAQRFWPNESPLGKRIRFTKTGSRSSASAATSNTTASMSRSDAEIYVPYPQTPAGV